MKKQYIVIALDNAEDFYIVDDLLQLMEEMYDGDFEDVEDRFYNAHKVIEVVGEIKEIN